MTIPHSKILSPTLTSPKSDASTTSKVEQNTNVNIKIKSENPNITPTVTPSVAYPPSSNPYGPTDLRHDVPYETRDVNINDESLTPDLDSITLPLKQQISTLSDSVEFLKLIIQAYRDNVVYVNKLIVLTESDLKNLINSLVHAESISITYDADYETCCTPSTKNQFSKIENILINTSNGSHNYKYTYSDAYGIIQAYQISLKYVQRKALQV